MSRFFLAVAFFATVITATVKAADDPGCVRPTESRTLLKWEKKDEPEGAEPTWELRLDQTTLQTISDITSQIAVVSIAGPHHTGKSYFLNNLASQLTSDTESPTISPFNVVDGLLGFESGDVNEDKAAQTASATDDVMSVVILPACFKPLPEQPNAALLLVDSAGLYAPKRPAVEEGQILAVLNAISSVVLFNGHTTFGRANVLSVHSAIHASRALEFLRRAGDTLNGDDGKDGSKDGEEDSSVGNAISDAINNRPNLLWLLQQSDQKTVEATVQEDSRRKHVDLLLATEYSGSVRDTFFRFFDKIDAAFLPFPVKDTELLSGLDSVPFAELAESYRNGMTDTTSRIRGMCAPRQLEGNPVNGPALGTALKHWVEQLKDFSGNNAAAVLEGLEKKELQFLAENYEQMIRSDLESESTEADIRTAHDNAYNEVIALAETDYANPREVSGEDDKVSIGHSDRRGAFIEDLKAQIQDRHSDICIEHALDRQMTYIELLKKAKRTVKDDHRVFAYDNSFENGDETVTNDDIEIAYGSINAAAAEVVTSVMLAANIGKDTDAGNAVEERISWKMRDAVRRELEVTPSGEDNDGAEDNGAMSSKDLQELNDNNIADGQRLDLTNSIEDAMKAIRDDGQRPCLESILLLLEASSEEFDQAIKNCRTAADEDVDNYEFEPAIGEESANVKTIAGKFATNLFDAAEKDFRTDFNKRRAGVESLYNSMTAFLNDASSKLVPPVEDSDLDKLKAEFDQELETKIVKWQEERGDPKVYTSEVQTRLNELVEQTLSDLRKGEEKAAPGASGCEEAADEYERQAADATSFFSLAALRYSGAPPFLSKDCMEDVTIQGRLSMIRASYSVRTWGRRWLTSLTLWFSVILTLTAGALVATGRRLQSSPVAIAFLASACFQFVVLCLAASEGLVFGFRAWTLTSIALLAYTASGGSGPGATRGRGSKRSMWSGSGRRVMNPGGGIMPLFRSNSGGASGGGTGAARARGGAGKRRGRDD